MLEITDAEGAAADAGLQTGDIIFGLDGVNYSADSVGFDPIAIESPSDEEESQVSDITSEATANDANDADGPDSDDEDTSVYQVGIDKCFPGMRLGANVNYGYGMVCACGSVHECGTLFVRLVHLLRLFAAFRMNFGSSLTS